MHFTRANAQVDAFEDFSAVFETGLKAFDVQHLFVQTLSGTADLKSVHGIRKPAKQGVRRDVMTNGKLVKFNP